MVYYNYFFHAKDRFTGSEGIVYSNLISHALMHMELFLVDGSFDIDLVKDTIREAAMEGRGECIEIYDPISINKLAKTVEMTRVQVRKILASLCDKGVLLDDYLMCPIEILDGGYIKLPTGTKLKGVQLTFYGHILEKSKDYNGSIDTMAYKLAEETGMTKRNAYSLLSILHKKGFVKRDDTSGKLIVY